ncbi:casein kinase 1-like protein HD16 [Morus notabilis]|uniref:casein kinase 1-like protein HD16 n=1 Tax=Morus notabilis TaxID=981085 RepID=UPI000CED7CBA|nr:casein kinase 1-like protein HD16 [Morus notabilis]
MARTRANVVKTLHTCVMALIGVSVAFLQLKQQSPFKTDYATMVAFLIAICIYVMTGLASIKCNGIAEEVSTKVSLLSGLLASVLLILVMVPGLGWVCLVLWVLLVVTITYKKISISRRPKLAQEDDQSRNHVAIQVTSVDAQERERLTTEEENIDAQLQRKISLGSPATKWISVYSGPQEMKQIYEFDVEDSMLAQKIEKGKEDGLFISSVASCSNLWALIMDSGTGFSEQVYHLSPHFLPNEWIKEQWEKGFHISAIAGAGNGSSLVVMSKGVQYLEQLYKVSDSFPLQWMKNKWKMGYYVTVMATSGRRWAIIMSLGAGISEQFVELESKYPSDGIRRRWKNGYEITATAATVDQAAVVLSMSMTKQREQETIRGVDFPTKYIEEKRQKGLYVTSICYGRTDE